MGRISKKELKDLANNIMLDFEDNELEKLSQEFDVILKQMDLVQKIDTTNVHSMHFPFDISVNYLRDDENGVVSEQKDILKLAPEISGDYIVINKVVK